MWGLFRVLLNFGEPVSEFSFDLAIDQRVAILASFDGLSDEK